MTPSSRLHPRFLVQATAAALAGYASALFGWQLTHRPQLEAYLLENQLARTERMTLLGWLVLGATLMVALWAWLTRNGNPRIRRFGLFSLLLIPLPLLPVLGIPDIESSHSLLVLSLIVLLSLLIALVVRSWQAHPQTVFVLPHDVTDSKKTRSIRQGLGLVLGLATTYAVFMSLLTLARHNTFNSYAFDLGIHSQSFYTITTRGYPLTTLYGPDPVNQFSDHFAPIFYLLTPAYLLTGVRGLLVLQSVALAAGAPAVYLLARHRLTSHSLAAVLSAAYLLFPALHGINHFDFHEIAFATPLLLWSLYFLVARRFRWFALLLLLALLTKEEVALTGASLGIYLLLLGETRRGTAVIALCLAYFLLVTGLIMPALGGGADVARFAGMTADGFSGFIGVGMTLVTNPIFTLLYALFDPDKLRFLAQLLLPVVLLPLAAPPATWIIAIPALATLLLSSYQPQYQLETHYPAIVIPAIFFLAIQAAARLEHGKLAAKPLAAAVLTASLLMNWQFGWLGGKLYNGIPQPTTHDRVLEQLIAAIPATASVSTMNNLVPHLSDRDHIYLFPIVADADYLLFDSSLSANYWPYTSIDPRGEAISALLPYLNSGDYGLVQQEDSVILLQRHISTTANQAAVATLLSVTYPAAVLRSSASVALQSDLTASGGLAKVSTGPAANNDEATALSFGPYVQMQPGRYHVTYRLKLQENHLIGQIATVDVFSYEAGGVLTAQSLDATQFSPGQYQDFDLDLQLTVPLGSVEFRVLQTGPGTLLLDTIHVAFLGP